MKTSNKDRRNKIVSIGGGTGQAMLLKGLKNLDIDITAIVTVLDSGRSTGEIRKNFGMVAPGDIRNCIIALSEKEDEFNKIFLHRFEKHFEGMNLGNLFLAALTEMKGSFGEAVEEFSEIFKLKGKVYPSTLKNTHVCAELSNGKILRDEAEIVKSEKQQNVFVKRLFLMDKNAKAYPKAVQAIKEADYIIVGPGGLYTSLIVNFLIEDLRKAFLQSKAKKIYIPNLATQPGVTDSLTLKNHVSELSRYILKKSVYNSEKKVFEYIIFNTETPQKHLINKYAKAGAHFLRYDEETKNFVEKTGTKIITGNLVDHAIRKEWAKKIYMRHDSDKLVKVLSEIVNEKKRIVGVILAAGTGKRMKPFSLSTSKVMIKFLGKPLISFHLDEFLKNDIKDIIIICNENNLNEIKTYFREKYGNLNISFTIQKQQLGPANALLSAEPLLKNSYFILKYGDSISKEDQIKGILETFNKASEKNGIVTLRDVDKPEEYGIARFENGRLVEIVEKPKSNPPSKLANVGLALLDADKFFYSLHKNGYEEVLPPPQYLLKENNTLGYWISTSERADVGRAYDIIRTNKIIIEKFSGMNKSPHVSKKAKISPNSFIGQNAVIEEGVEIQGYSSVEGYVGKNTKIINSVIMENTRIGKNCVIENSVIGKNNLIEDGLITESKKATLFINNKHTDPGMPVGLFTGENVIIKNNIKSSAGKMVFPNKIISNNILGDKLTRAIVFDADNTIYDTKATTPFCDLKVMEYFSSKTGINKEELYQEWTNIVKKVINIQDPKKRQRKYSYNLLLQKYKSKNKKELLKKGMQILYKEIENRITLMPGFEHIKNTLHNYKLAICSEDTKEQTNIKLKKLKLDGFFDAVINSDDVGKMKPSQKYYELLFKKLDIDPAECLFIGDSYEKDLEIPKRMGATTIIISKKEDKRADFHVKDYNELEKILKEI